jgi:hypothetical protein
MSKNNLRTDYYIKQKPKLMEQFDKFLRITKDILVEQYTDSKAENLINQIRDNYEEIIPEIPYIGGRKNVFTSILIDCVANIPIIRILEKERFTYREIGEFTYKFWELVNKIRKRKLEKQGLNPTDQYFNKAFVDYMKKSAERSQKKQFTYDFVWEFVEGDGIKFDYGYNYSECGIQKIFKKLGAEKYMPFVCLADFATANVYGFGFTRTQTLGNGAPLCDHRYKRDGETARGWPPDHLEEFKMEQMK